MDWLDLDLEFGADDGLEGYRLPEQLPPASPPGAAAADLGASLDDLLGLSDPAPQAAPAASSPPPPPSIPGAFLEARLDELLGLSGAEAEAAIVPAAVEDPAEAAPAPPKEGRTLEELRAEGAAHGEAMEATFERIREFAPNLPHLSVTPIEVVTMTVLTFINKKIFFNVIDQRKEDDDVKEFVDSVMHGWSEDTFTLPNGERKCFDNSITVRYKQDTARNTHAVKMFRNGKFHMTGVVTLSEALETSDIMCTLLDVVRGVPFDTHRTMDYEVEMINTSFRVGYTINLPRALELWRQQHPALYASYEPDVRKKALNIYYRSEEAAVETLHVFCYASGSLAITGCIRTPATLYDAYAAVTGFLDRNRGLLELKHRLPPAGPGAARKRAGAGAGAGKAARKGRRVLEYDRFIEMR